MQTHVVRGQTSLRTYAEKLQQMLSLRFGPSEMTMTEKDFGATHFSFVVGIRPDLVDEARMLVRGICCECKRDGHSISIESSLFDQPLCVSTAVCMVPI